MHTTCSIYSHSIHIRLDDGFSVSVAYTHVTAITRQDEHFDDHFVQKFFTWRYICCRARNWGCADAPPAVEDGPPAVEGSKRQQGSETSCRGWVRVLMLAHSTSHDTPINTLSTHIFYIYMYVYIVYVCHMYMIHM